MGQVTLALILFFFIRFFLFGDEDAPDTRAAARAAARRQRTLSHSATLRRKRSANFNRHVSIGSRDRNALTPEEILAKTYYNVDGHQPESLDWFNVLIAQTIAQLRADALNDDAILSSLSQALNGPHKPDVVDEIRVTEISLGEEFPIFSNCRVIPVDEDGTPVKAPIGRKGGLGANLGESTLQARMDVDLGDVITLGVETKLVLNYPKPRVAVMPVALSVSVMRFSGTLSVSFTPSTSPSTSRPDVQQPTTADASRKGGPSHSTSQPSHSPTTLTFTFLDDYRLDLSIHSLIGSRSRLQDVPKIAQLIEQRIHAWFDERCVEPRFQQIVLPSLWPRKKNVRGGADDDTEGGDDAGESAPEEAILDSMDGSVSSHQGGPQQQAGRISATTEAPRVTGAFPTADGPARRRPQGPRKPPDLSAEEDNLAQAGAEIRAAEQRDRERDRERDRQSREQFRTSSNRDSSRTSILGQTRSNSGMRARG